jgi:hypothetical protein
MKAAFDFPGLGDPDYRRAVRLSQNADSPMRDQAKTAAFLEKVQKLFRPICLVRND